MKICASVVRSALVFYENTINLYVMNKSILDVLNFQPCTPYEAELEYPEEVISNY